MGRPGVSRLAAAAVGVAVLATMWFIGTRGGSSDPTPAPEVADDPFAVAEPEAVESVPFDDSELGGLTFVDVTLEAGLGEPQSARELEGDENISGSAAAGDFDDDGDIDIVLTRFGLPNLLYRNDGSGGFTEVAEASGVAAAVPPTGSGTPLLADVDGDADLDLFLTGNPSGGRALFLNDGDGTFTDSTAASGLDIPTTPGESPQSFGAAFADWDHDGDLDLTVVEWYAGALQVEGMDTIEDFMSLSMCEKADTLESLADNGAPTTHHRPSLSRMYRNDGGAVFTDVTAGSGIDFSEVTAFTPTFADIDNDGWEDLLVAGDFCTSRIYLNEAGSGFTDITDSAGVGGDENGMGSVVEDFDRDGNLDWFVTSVSYPTGDGNCPFVGHVNGCSGNRLYLGDGNGSFVDATDDFGVRDGSWGWGAIAEDLNNDGQTELFMANGYWGEDAREEFEDDPNRLWLGRAEGPRPEVSGVAGLDDRANGKAVIPFDMDSDGDLDLLVANTTDPPLLYRNDTPLGNHWVRVELSQPGPNTRGVGATVVVHPSGAEPITREVRAGGPFQGSVPTELHFGIGDADIERIEVFWPGEEQPQVLTSPEADRLVVVERS